jgi:DNA helicase-2/ATP-dependent DNA helicase PcrA
MSMAFDFGTANENQKKAIQATDGPVLIIAGPGTGKTFTLVNRAVYLITEKDVKPENIMIATFTEKATKEIVTRITNELLKLEINVNVNELYIGTLHSICLRLIKGNLEHTRLKKSYRLLDDFEQKYFVFQKIKQFGAIPNVEVLYGNRGLQTSSWQKAGELVYYLNAIEEELVTLDGLSTHSSLEIRTLGEIIKKYEALLTEENTLDFAHIQSMAFRLLNEHPEITKKVQDEIKYIMIDDYQDTNYVQEQLVFLIGKEHNNICVVGDDDQGLYRFRGATIRNILEFPEQFPDCARITLSENYRSEKDIVRFYNEWMTETEGRGFTFEWGGFRFDKRIMPAKKRFIEGAPTVIKVGAGDEEQWNASVLDFIGKLKGSGKITDYNQIAFLFRSVKGERVKALADFLERNGVPVYSPRSDLFFDRDEIRLIIGALMACFPDFVTRLNKGEMRSSPDLQRYYVDCIKAFADHIKENKNEELTKFIQFRARDHAAPTKNFDYAFTGLLYRILQFEPFRSFMSLDISGITDTRPLRNLANFSNITTRYEYLHRITIFTAASINRDVDFFFNVYMRFLMDGGIDEYEDEAEYAPSGCVSFMTIHQSKGLEFPVVIVGSLSAVPRDSGKEITETLEADVYHRKPYEPYDRVKLFDFWRLFYTAFSRAQNLLVLTAREREGHGSEPSKYFRMVYDGMPYYFNPDIDYAKYEFDRIKDVNIKQSYSFTSHIALYENCALQYKFFKELGFIPVRTGSTLFGTLVHQTIEDIHRAVLRGEPATITEPNIKTWFENNYANLSKKEHSYLASPAQDAALRQVLKYADKQTGDWARVLDAEVEVSHVEPDYILKGKIDLIRGEGDTVEIVDFKAEKKPDMEGDKANIERYHRQLQLYAYIVEQRFNLTVSKMRLYYTGETEGIPTIDFPNRASDMVKTIRAIDGTVQKIKCKDFSGRAATEKLCKGCDLRHYCGKI